MAAQARWSVPGSEKRLPAEAEHIGDVDPDLAIEITVMLRPRDNAVDAAAQGEMLPAQRTYATRESLAEARGADPADIEKVEDFAHEHHLTVLDTDVAKRMMRVSGRIGDLSAAFQPDLKRYRLADREFRGRAGDISVPQELSGVVTGVFGFDDRPAVRPHLRPHATAQPATVKQLPAGTFTPPDVAKAYNFPGTLDGRGQCIALLELNDTDSQGRATATGYSQADLRSYFTEIGVKKPRVTAIGVDGGANRPGTNPGNDGEVMLDIEVAGAIAPKAKIAVYFAPNTDQGFIDGVAAAIHDTRHRPSILSISWGGPEDEWTQQSRNAIDQLFQDAAALGVTVCCAAGDNGSSDQPLNDGMGHQLRDGKLHVDFPSASPFALACGGTKLVMSKSGIAEGVWNEGDSGGATGGGVSIEFSLPDYQRQSKVPTAPNGFVGRGVPDVAGDADPNSGYFVRTGGQNAIIGGTSAVAPLMASLVALINQSLESQGKPTAGFLNPLLYGAASAAMRDISTPGSNDIDGSMHEYATNAGWDACTGLGVPDGTALMQALGG